MKNIQKIILPVAISLLFILPKISEATTIVKSTSTSSTSPATSTGATNTQAIDASMLYTNSKGIPIYSSLQVMNDEDLIVFEENQGILNPNVRKVSSDLNSNGIPEITIQYEHPGKFLGFLPVGFKSTTNITTTDGGTPEVSSKLSTLSTLVGDKKFDPNSLDAMLLNNESVRNDLVQNATPSQQAKVAEAAIQALDAYSNNYEVK